MSEKDVTDEWVTIDQLRKGDVILIKGGKEPFTVTKSERVSATMELWAVGLRGLPSISEIVADPGMKVLLVEMFRLVEVPCRAARHQGGLFRMKHDFATGSAPIAVICGRCDDEITADVVAAMKEPRRGDVVVLGGSAVKIAGFDEDDGTRLDNGQWICASKLVSIGDRRWRYDESQSNG